MDHAQGLVSKDFRHSAQVNPAHDEIGCCGVSKIVENEILNLGGSEGIAPRLLKEDGMAGILAGEDKWGVQPADLAPLPEQVQAEAH